MAKQSVWRKVVPKSVLQNQIRALESNMYFLVRQNGPLAFSVQQLNKLKPFEVRLGDPHRCTCKWYNKTFDLCVHICWIMLKKFRIGVRDTISFQLGMSTEELRNCVSGRRRPCEPATKRRNINTAAIMTPVVQKRCRTDEDTCPICLDSYSSTIAAVTYCKYSCGNAVHARCMAMLVRHRESETTGEAHPEATILKCPLCRGNFNTISAIKLEIHRALAKQRNTTTSVVAPIEIHSQTCRFCKTRPIRGNLYRCLECDQVILCGCCISNQDFHIYHGTHDYAIKEKSDGPWRRLGKVEENLKAFNTNGNTGVAAAAAARRCRCNRPPASSTKATQTRPAAVASQKSSSNLLEFSKGFSFNCYRRSDNSAAVNLATSRRIPFSKTTRLNNNNISNNVLGNSSSNILAAICDSDHDLSPDDGVLADDIEKDEKCLLPDLSQPQKFIKFNCQTKATESKTQNLPSRNGPGEGFNLPLEVRVSRMHLEKRPKESGSKPAITSTTAQTTSNTSNPRRAKKVSRKMPKSQTLLNSATVDEQSLSLQINPLMTILMSPHLRKLIDQESSEENKTVHHFKSLAKTQVKSLDFPDDVVSFLPTTHKSRSTPSLRAVQRAFNKSRSSVIDSFR